MYEKVHKLNQNYINDPNRVALISIVNELHSSAQFLNCNIKLMEWAAVQLIEKQWAYRSE